MRAAPPDVSRLPHEALGQFILHAQVPLMHRRHLVIRIKRSDRRCVAQQRRRQREKRRRLRGRRGQRQREAFGDALVHRHGGATRRRRDAHRGLASRHQARRAAHHRRHLKRRNRVESNAVARANDELVALARTPGNAQTRAEGQRVIAVVKAVALAIRDRPLRTVNRLVVNVNPPGGFFRRRVVFHPHAVIDRQILPQLPFILPISVVLFDARAHSEKRNLAVGDERQEGIALNVADENLRQPRRNAQHVVDRAAQPRQIGSVDAGSRAQRRSQDRRAERKRRRHVDAAGLSALIVVLIKADVEARADLMRTVQDAQVVHQLRRRHTARRARRVDERQARVVEGVRHDVREIGIGFALREEEEEARETHNQLVVDVRRELRAPAHRKIFRRTINLAQRRKAGEHLRASVQRIAFARVLVGIQEAGVNRVAFVDGVVNARRPIRPLILRRRIPGIGRSVQAIAHRVIVRLRISAEQLGDGRVNADLARVVGENVVTRHAIQFGRRRAIAHARDISARAPVNQQGAVGADRRPIELERIGRIRFEIAVFAR